MSNYGKIIVMFIVFGGYGLLVGGNHARSEIYQTSFEFNYDLTVDRSDTGDETDNVFNQILNLDYSKDLLPHLSVDTSLKLDLEEEFQSDDDDTIRFLPEFEINADAKYWELGLGAKRNWENSNDPFEATQIKDTYFVEYFFDATDLIPDLKAKYTIDTDKNGVETNTRGDSLELSSTYDVGDIMGLRFDFTKDESEDKINPDSNTVDENLKGEANFKYIFTKKLKFDFKYQYELDTGGTLLDAGGRTNEKSTTRNTLDGMVTYRIFPKTDMDVSHQFKEERDKVERSRTTNNEFEANFNQGVGENIEFEFSFKKTEETTKGILEDITTSEDKFTYDLGFDFSEFFDFTFKYEQTLNDTVDGIDPLKNLDKESNDFSITWSADTPTFFSFKVSYNLGEDKENDLLVTKDRDFSFSSVMDFVPINLKLDQRYDLTITEDFTSATDRKKRTTDFSLGFDYDVDVTKKLNISLSHDFGRKVEQPGKVIQRDDDTTLDFNLEEPWEGSTFTLSFSRDATDKSGDDTPPDINSNITFSWDHTLGQFDFSMNYQYDNKKLTDNTETFDLLLGWLGRNFDTSIKFSFDKTFSQELDETYQVTWNFKYEF